MWFLIIHLTYPYGIVQLSWIILTAIRVKIQDGKDEDSLESPWDSTGGFRSSKTKKMLQESVMVKLMIFEREYLLLEHIAWNLFTDYQETFWIFGQSLENNQANTIGCFVIFFPPGSHNIFYSCSILKDSQDHPLL